MNGMGIWFMILLVSVVSLGCFVGVLVLNDVMVYRDLRRLLREERERREPFRA